MINGKMVLGEQQEIQEVKNAYAAYERLSEIDPYSIRDLKEIPRYYDKIYRRGVR